MGRSPRRRPRSLKPGAHAPTKQDTQVVTAEQLREIFAQARILERVIEGSLTERILRTGSPEPLFNFPDGTESQIVGYFNEHNKQMAEAHRYVLPDGTLGASGRPDPKVVFHKGILYFIVGYVPRT